MLFTSWEFLPFIVVVFGLYWTLPFRAQNLMLLIASYVFYGAWDWRFLGLIVLSTTIDYQVGLKLKDSNDPKRRKFLLALSCTANLGMLSLFKYFDFFSTSTSRLLAAFGVHADPLLLDIVLPVGISFYTFQTMSYTIDIYRQKLEPVKHPLDFALFVSFFPQLVAGPIERAATLLPQILKPRRVAERQLIEGFHLILWGFFKKMVIADNLAIVVDRVFNAPTPPSGAHCVIAIYAFAFQIYGDFSGYTDIARGLAKLMGFELMLNFNLPYLATSPSDFWRRWHISLSTWLRDYLYIPLGGNRGSQWQTYRNLMLTMLLGGLWHGAAWNFVVWGAYHGGLLAIHRVLTKDRAAKLKPHKHWNMQRVLSVIVMFHLTCFGWLLFRVQSLSQVGQMLEQIFLQFSPDRSIVKPLAPMLLVLIMLGIEAWLRGEDNPAQRPGWLRFGPIVATAMFASIVVFSPSGSQQFIYFQF